MRGKKKARAGSSSQWPQLRGDACEAVRLAAASSGAAASPGGGAVAVTSSSPAIPDASQPVRRESWTPRYKTPKLDTAVASAPQQWPSLAAAGAAREDVDATSKDPSKKRVLQTAAVKQPAQDSKSGKTRVFSLLDVVRQTRVKPKKGAAAFAAAGVPAARASLRCDSQSAAVAVSKKLDPHAVPKKKNLTSLKKRILLERVERYYAAHPDETRAKVLLEILQPATAPSSDADSAEGKATQGAATTLRLRNVSRRSELADPDESHIPNSHRRPKLLNQRKGNSLSLSLSKEREREREASILLYTLDISTWSMCDGQRKS